MSCSLSGDNESRKSSNTGKLALFFFQMQAFSDPVLLQSDVYICIRSIRCNFTENKRFPFNAQIQFMLVVNLINAVVKLTYGDYNGKWKIMKMYGFLLVSGTSTNYISVPCM